MSAKRTTLPTSKLIPNSKKRPRSPEQRGSLSKSVTRDGFLSDFLVAASLVNQGYYDIISGNTRWEIANELGIEEVPVTILPPGLTRAEGIRLSADMDSLQHPLHFMQKGQAVIDLAHELNIGYSEAAKQFHGIERGNASKITTIIAKLCDDAKYLVMKHGTPFSCVYEIASKIASSEKQVELITRFHEEKWTRAELLKVLKGGRTAARKLKVSFVAHSGVTIDLCCPEDAAYQHLLEAAESLIKHLTKQQKNGVPLRVLPQI